MRIAVVDDELQWRSMAKFIIGEYCKDDEVEIDEYDNGVKYLKTQTKYDLTFMDIEMPGLDGFETISRAKRYNRDGLFVILTTHKELSTKGYKVDAFRYIDKARLQDIDEAIYSAEILLKRNEKITVKVIEDGFREVVLKDIIYIETEKHYTWVHTIHNNYRCSNKISEFEEMLEGRWFYRCHQAIIVNLDEINDIEKDMACMSNGDKIDIAKRKIGNLKKAYLDRMFECANG